MRQNPLADLDMPEKRQNPLTDLKVSEGVLANLELGKQPLRQKGLGYFGELKRPDGKISTELSIGVNIDGKEIEIPSLVPTLRKDEIDYLLKGNKPSEQIINKAVGHARIRIAQGKSPFAQKGEQPEGHWKGWIKPSLEEAGRRATIGTAESILTLASPITTYPAGILSGLVHSIWGGEAARAAEEDVMALGYQPLSQEGIDAVQKVGWLMEKGLWPAHKAGQELTEMGYPRLGYYLEKTGELATFAAGGAIVKGVIPKGPPKPVTPKGVKPAYPEYAEPKEALEAKLKPKEPLELKVKKEPAYQAIKPTEKMPEVLYKERGKTVKEKLEAKIEEKAKLPPEKAKIAPRIEVKAKEVKKPLPSKEILEEVMEGTKGITAEEVLKLYKAKPIIPPAPKKIAKPQGVRSIITDIVDEGGLYDKILPGELRDLVQGYSSKLGTEKFKRIPKLINKETGKAIDEMQSILTSERGYKIEDVNQFLELFEKDLRAIAEGKAESRVRPLTDETLTDKMWTDYMKEEMKDGVSETKARESLEREVTDKVAKEAEFARAEREAIQSEYRAVSEEVKPAPKVTSKVIKEAETTPILEKYALKKEQGELILKASSYLRELSTKKPKVAEELKPRLEYLNRINNKQDIGNARLYKSIKELHDKIENETRPGQPSLIKEPAPFELKMEEGPPKLLGPQGKKAVMPTEKIKAATKGEQKTLLPPKKGEQVAIFESLGFQSMYENTVKRLKRTKVQRPKEDIKRFDKGMVIKQRTAKNIKCPPVYEAELKIVKKVAETDMSHPVLHGMQNPPRTFDQYFGEDFKSMTYWQVQEASHRANLEVKVFHKQIKAFKKEVSHGSSKRIKIYEIAQQEGGKARLAAQGVKEIPKLTAKEMIVYRKGEHIYRRFYMHLNKARVMSGKEPFGKVENYGPFIHELGLLEQMGLSPGLDRLKVLEAKFIQMRSVPFRHAKERAKFYDKPLELDYFSTMDKYGHAAINHIHMGPTISKLHEFTLTFGEGPAKWRMQEAAPNKARWYRAWLDHVAGKPTWDLGPVDRALTTLNKNAAYAILSGNVRSAIIQPSALMHTYVELGHKYTLEGILSLLDPKKRNFALEKSNHLLGRNYDVAVRDVFESMRTGKIGGVKEWVGKKGIKGLQILDFETAKATWQGAYLRATKKLNCTEAKAIRYADDVVIRTQASAARADTAPIQRARVGRALTLFQTFVINEWNFMMSDVLGYKNPKVRGMERLSRISKFIVGTTLVNMFYEDVLGLHSPYPSPIRAYREAVERGADWPSQAKEVLKELIEKVPIIGSARYGTMGPAWLSKVTKAIYAGKGGIETTATLLGITGTAQIRKMIRAQKRGGTMREILLGVYPEEKKKRKLKKLKTLRGSIKFGK